MSMQDYYLQHPEALKGQPKRTIGDYVGQQGILVPRRFDSLAEAQASGLPILARSEHPQEYDGVSGLLHSTVIGSEDTEEKLRERVLSKQVDKYCQLTGTDMDEFCRQVSLSYWQLILGFNHMIVADTAIQNRFHITTNAWNFTNYTIHEGGRSMASYGGTWEGLEKIQLALINMYERVRNLERFDPNHCPIMEAQSSEGKVYFLQYHRTRDFAPAQFVLDQKKGIEAFFVRGATPLQGVTYAAVVAYGAHMKPGAQWLLGPEQASFSMTVNRVFTELMTRQRKLEIIELDYTLDLWLRKVSRKHEQQSLLFKPEISIVIPEGLMDDGEYSKLVLAAYNTDQNQCIDVHVVSDGRIAYIERI